VHVIVKFQSEELGVVFFLLKDVFCKGACAGAKFHNSMGFFKVNLLDHFFCDKSRARENCTYRGGATNKFH
jgi:hypothetical protein